MQAAHLQLPPPALYEGRLLVHSGKQPSFARWSQALHPGAAQLLDQLQHTGMSSALPAHCIRICQERMPLHELCNAAFQLCTCMVKTMWHAEWALCVHASAF